MPDAIRALLFIARKDLAYMIRQWETILWTFVMPILFFYFIGTVTGGFASPAGSRDAPNPLVLHAPEQGGAILDQIVRRLEEQNFRIVRPATAEEAARYRRHLIVPEPPEGHATLTDAVRAGAQVTLNFRRRGDGVDSDFDVLRIRRAVYAVVADLAVLKTEDEAADSAAFARLAAMPRALTLRVVPAGARVEPPAGFAQAIPGTMVMFTMLILLTSGAILLVTEREQGLLRRLASTPISRASVVSGKWAGKMTLGLVQIAFAMGVGTLLFRMDWGRTWPMVGLVLFAWAAFNASLGIVLGNLARTPAQTAGIGVISTLVLAALGGAWWPIEITPAWMQALALGIPTGWTMDAMHKLVNFGYGSAVAIPHVGALALGAVILGWIGARTFRYQ